MGSPMVSAAISAVEARIAAIEASFPAALQSATPVGTASFATAMASALGQSAGDTPGGTSVAATAVTASTVAAPTATRTGGVTSTSMGRGGAPAELVAFGNGRVPDDALVPIGVGHHQLWGPAAEAFVSMRARAGAEGIDIGVTDSYRSLHDQEHLAATKGIYGQGGLAAVPGTSNHGWGRSLDLDVGDRATLDWLRANGPSFGFHEDVPGEPWHWTYRPA